MTDEDMTGNKLHHTIICRNCSVQENRIFLGMLAVDEHTAIRDIEHPSYRSDKYRDSSLVYLRQALSSYQKATKKKYGNNNIGNHIRCKGNTFLEIRWSLEQKIIFFFLFLKQLTDSSRGMSRHISLHVLNIAVLEETLSHRLVGNPHHPTHVKVFFFQTPLVRLRQAVDA